MYASKKQSRELSVEGYQVVRSVLNKSQRIEVGVEMLL